jgi:hypothetical protein
LPQVRLGKVNEDVVERDIMSTRKENSVEDMERTIDSPRPVVRWVIRGNVQEVLVGRVLRCRSSVAKPQISLRMPSVLFSANDGGPCAMLMPQTVEMF